MPDILNLSVRLYHAYNGIHICVGINDDYAVRIETGLQRVYAEDLLSKEVGHYLRNTPDFIRSLGEELYRA